MSIVVVGSIAFDSIKTPFGAREKSLGGAANYFAMAAKFFNKVKMIGVIGEDFPQSHLDYLKKQGIELEGIKKLNGQSFHWQGEYGFDLNEAITIRTELNVYKDFFPIIPNSYQESDILFLANIDPVLQMSVLEQMKKPKIVALDTMNFWIKNKYEDLIKAISLVDILFINDAEIRELTRERNVVKASKKVMELGAKIVVIKRGEYGSLLRYDDHLAFMPAFPLEDVFDPTGAGDVFAGGFLGYLSSAPSISPQSLKKAMLYGTVMSSFVIEQFSFDRLKEIEKQHIEERACKLAKIINVMDL